MPSLPLIAILLSAVATALHATPVGAAEPAATYFGGALGGELWYADWSSENQWSKEGVDIEYDIEPSFIQGYHTAFVRYAGRHHTTALALNYLTSKLSKDTPAADPHENGDGKETYRQIQALLDQRIGNGYVHCQVMRAEFDGTVRITSGGNAFDPAKGDRFPVKTQWFKADTLYLKEVGEALGGIGLRYISYNKPEATSRFVAGGPGDGLTTGGDLVAGEILETTYRGYYLLFGILDKSYLGIPTEMPAFFDALFYLGVATAKNDVLEDHDGFGGGVEASLGLKHSYRFLGDRGKLTLRAGYRVLYNKIGNSQKEGTDEHGNEVFRVTETIDTWHGPFAGLTLSF
jgi:hypothetical protein